MRHCTQWEGEIKGLQEGNGTQRCVCSHHSGDGKIPRESFQLIFFPPAQMTKMQWRINLAIFFLSSWSLQGPAPRLSPTALVLWGIAGGLPSAQGPQWPWSPPHSNTTRLWPFLLELYSWLQNYQQLSKLCCVLLIQVFCKKQYKTLKRSFPGRGSLKYNEEFENWNLRLFGKKE